MGWTGARIATVMNNYCSFFLLVMILWGMVITKAHIVPTATCFNINFEVIGVSRQINTSKSILTANHAMNRMENVFRYFII